MINTIANQRHHWPFDIGPGSDIQSRVVVCKVNVPAGYTSKLGLRTPVRFVDTPAYVAAPAGVSRINVDHRNTGTSGLIYDVGLQLKESPVSVSRSLLAFYRYPLAYASQIFETYTASGVFRLIHDTFRDNVVNVILKFGLSTRDLFELAPGRLRAFALKIATGMRELPSVDLNRRSTIRHTIAVGRQVNNAEVNSKHVGYINRFGIVKLARHEQVPLITDIAQVGFATIKAKQFKLSLTSGKGDFQTTINCPDRHGLAGKIPTEDARIIRDSAVRLECAHRFLIQLVRIGNLSQSTDNDLRSQCGEFLATRGICDLLQLESSEYLLIPGHAAEEITSLIRRFKRTFERISLRLVGNQLDFRCKDHQAKYSIGFNYLNVIGRQFLPALETGASLPRTS